MIHRLARTNAGDIIRGPRMVLIDNHLLESKRERSTYMKINRCMRGNGKALIDMVMVCRYGRMAQNMKETGDLIKHVVMESSGTLMEISLKANG